MDEKVLETARQLRAQLENVDPEDYYTLAWSHGFLNSVIQYLESRLPDYMIPKGTLENIRAVLDSMLQQLGNLDDSDEPGDAPVPAKLKPGPKGLSGGAIAPLPDNELPL